MSDAASDAGSSAELICHLTYRLAPGVGHQFERYAQIWMMLVERHGGTHCGYFIATETPSSQAFSFPGLGRDGEQDRAFALFRFPSLAAYEAYRRNVASEPECEAANAILSSSRCFLEYERTFVRAIRRD